MSGGFQNVHIRVNDSDTGKPTPVRIRFAGAGGKYAAPFGRLTEFATAPADDVGGNVLVGDTKFAYIDGACEIRLPVGHIEVEIHKGPEYLPEQTQVNLPQGKLALRFEIKRWSDLRQQGYYGGDTHCFYLSPHAALLEAAGEDLAVVNLLARPVHRPGSNHVALSNILAFSGQKPALAMPGHLVAVNTFNQHAHLGQLALLNCHRAVYPLTFGSPDGVDDWNLADWCEQCHRKRGLVVATHFLADDNWQRGEILADALLGYIDAVDVGHADLADADSLKPWEELLSCGLRIPLSGGSGKCSNTSTLGRVRTYAQLLPGEEFTYTSWIDAVRAGRTFVTSGPLLFFTVNDQGPGSVLDVATAGEELRLQAEVRSLVPFDKLEIIANGAVVAEASAATKEMLSTSRIEQEFSAENSGWLYARCTGPAGGAYTSPIYVQIADRPFMPDEKIIQTMLQRLDGMLDWVDREGKFANDNQRERMASVYKEAGAKLR